MHMSYLLFPRCDERIEVFGPSQAAENYRAESFQAIVGNLVQSVPAKKTKPIF